MEVVEVGGKVFLVCFGAKAAPEVGGEGWGLRRRQRRFPDHVSGEV